MAYLKSAGVSDPFYMKKYIDDTETGATVTTTGTTQAAGVALTGTMCAVTAAAGSGSVNLPSAKAGVFMFVRNVSASNALAVFSSNASTTDTINGTIGTTAYSLAATKGAVFFSPADGVWHVILSA